MTENEFILLYAIKKYGVKTCRELSQTTGESLGYISKAINNFRKKGWIENKSISAEGLRALLPYKVDSAIILAAGLSSRFVPLSLEKPKGLLKVKNEILIERQIEQLKDAGIKEIILVLGYKKESFFYLQDKYDVKIVVNPEYNKKNNIESLRIAEKYIKNSYICSSDDYFSENVFEEYVYRSYYASVYVDEKTPEWYMIPDSKMNIKKVCKSGEAGCIMLGQVYWDKEFSSEFKQLIDLHSKIGDYDSNLWEDLFADNIKSLPPMKINVFPAEIIHEFDSLDELRKFDEEYINNSKSNILHNISMVLKCKECEIEDFRPIKEGLTNTSFIFRVGQNKFVYRHPGDGTEKIISRANEKKSLEIAKELNIDPTYIYMDSNQGWKISIYKENVRIPDYQNLDDSKRVIDVLKKLHSGSMKVEWKFSPWELANEMEVLLKEKTGIALPDFEILKRRVEKCYLRTKKDSICECFCHCDTYGPNWMLTNDETILIDWEYAGNADPGCDVGGYIMDAMYDIDKAKCFIKEYCGSDFSAESEYHYLAFVAIISYYWFVWALYRESCGAVMGKSLHNWYVMANRYSKYLEENEE